MEYLVIVTKSGVVTGRVDLYSAEQGEHIAAQLQEKLGGRIVRRSQETVEVWEIDTTQTATHLVGSTGL